MLKLHHMAFHISAVCNSTIIDTQYLSCLSISVLLAPTDNATDWGYKNRYILYVGAPVGLILIAAVIAIAVKCRRPVSNDRLDLVKNEGMI